MRSPTFATLLCLACALPALAQDDRSARAGPAPPAVEPAKTAAPAGKQEGGFWSWFGRRDESAAPRADRVEIPDRVERPERIERPDRPERASGGCCQ